MEGIIVYFSRTGRTRKVAEAIQVATGFDIEEIKEGKSRGGPLGWLKSGMESTRKMLPKIGPLACDPSKYDLVVIGSPIWASNMSSPVRAFVTEYRGSIKDVALFCTGDGDEPEKVFNPVSELLGMEPKAAMGLIGSEREEKYAALKIKEFAAKLSA